MASPQLGALTVMNAGVEAVHQAGNRATGYLWTRIIPSCLLLVLPADGTADVSSMQYLP